MFGIFFFWICSSGYLLGCAPGFQYIAPSQTSPRPQEPCRDCSQQAQMSKEDSRFFTDVPCCGTSPNKVGPGRLKNATDCGRKGPGYDNRVVGGVSVRENEIPWQVALLHQNGSWTGCNAILLSCDPVIVITAAHCVTSPLLPEEKPPTKNRILGLGSHRVSFVNPSPMDKNEVRLEVEEIIVHPSFSQFTLHTGISQRNNLNVTSVENDIAVIKVKNGSTLKCKRKVIWPACFPRKGADYRGWNQTILSGWGKVDGGEIFLKEPRTLRKGSLTIIGAKKCNILSTFSLPFSLGEKQLCAIDYAKKIGSCQGDSGGPLVAKDSNSEGYAAVGVVSWGQQNCTRNSSSIYSEVGQYLDWIGSQFDLLPPA